MCCQITHITITFQLPTFCKNSCSTWHVQVMKILIFGDNVGLLFNTYMNKDIITKFKSLLAE